MNLAQIAYTLYEWMDLFWIPVALFLMERGKKLLSAGFVLSCVLLLRLQVELMQQVGFPYGYFGWIHADVFTRGLITYSCFTGFFLLIAYYSKGTDQSIFMAAAISILIAAFCVSSVVMVL